jgi:hypothetical protein
VRSHERERRGRLQEIVRNETDVAFVYTGLDGTEPSPIAIDFSELRFKIITANVYPASLRGLIDHRQEPRWVFARSPSTTPKHWPKPCRSRHQVRQATEVTRFAIFRYSIAVVGKVLLRTI